MNAVNSLIHRVIFPDGLKKTARREMSEATGQKARGAVKAAADANSSFQTLATFNTRDGFRMVGVPKVKGFPVPVPTSVTFREGAGRRGDWVIRPERVDVLGIHVRQALEPVRAAMGRQPGMRPEAEWFRVAIAGSPDFRVLWTRKTETGIRMVGLPRMRGLTLPLPTSVEFSKQSGSLGRFALRPERVTIAGIPSQRALESVTRALGENPGLRRDGDRFLVLLG